MKEIKHGIYNAYLCARSLSFKKKEMSNLISAPTFSRLVQDPVPPSSQGGKARKKRGVRKLEENHSFYLGKCSRILLPPPPASLRPVISHPCRIKDEADPAGSPHPLSTAPAVQDLWRFPTSLLSLLEQNLCSAGASWRASGSLE